MTRIDDAFKTAQRFGDKVFVAYITAGYPDMETTVELIHELARRGVNIIELGVPFSDPIADGKTIQASSQAALDMGVNLPMILKAVKEVRKTSEIPLVLMGYFNPIMQAGGAKALPTIKKAGVDGLIIPDLPPDEEADFAREAKNVKISLIYLLAPTSTPDRINLVANKSTGFVYYVSLTGVTGARAELPSDITGHVEEIRKAAKLPIAVGFGISRPDQAVKVAGIADGVIVGSAIINAITESMKSHKKPKTIAQDVGDFVTTLIKAIR
jgi:tryptophan synthase alpha chain